MPPRLLALDMDGTLLRADGAVDPRDADAVRRAQGAGVRVTIATGRLSSGALPTARALGLREPLVCADGSVLVCARTGALLEQTPIPLAVATAAMRTLCDHALAPFVLTHDTVHCEDSGRPHASWVSVWSLEMTVHARLLDAPAWQEREAVAFAVGIGARDRAEAACAALDRDHGAHVEVASFRVSRPGEHWAVLARPRGASKGAALAKLAEKLGVAREHAAVVGDWYNDVSMFRWAGRSFAMGQAPAAVQAVASETLVATSSTGGGVAEAVERWLEGTRGG